MRFKQRLLTLFIKHVNKFRFIPGDCRLSDSDLSHVTSVGEIVVARAHITVLPRLRDAEAWRVAGGWGVIQLSLQVRTGVTSLVEVKIQLLSIKLVDMINHFKRQAGTSCWFERAASLFYPTHIRAIRTYSTNGTKLSNYVITLFNAFNKIC